MPFFKNADVYIKPGAEDGGGGGGWGRLIAAVLIVLGVMGVINLLGFTPHDSFEYQPGLYRRCEVRSIFFIIQLEKKCTVWFRNDKGRIDMGQPVH